MISRSESRARREEVHQVAVQAAEWLRQLQDNEKGTDGEFLKWMQESPLHVREFLQVWALDHQLAAVDAERRIDIEAIMARISNVVPFGAYAPVAASAAPAAPSPQRWLTRIAAGVAILGVLAAGAVFMRNSDGAYATQIGEQRNFELDDGSVVFLNTDSRVTVRFSKESRDIDLQTGQALFDVEHDAKRPFRVHVGSTVVQAIGTQFDVRRAGTQVLVAVVEGTVEVSDTPLTADVPLASAGTVPARFKAGQAATIEQGRIMPSGSISPAAATAWRNQQLIFEKASLAQIVNEFNRYNRVPKLRVEGDAADRRFNGVFGARNPESLLTYLARKDLAFERRGEEIVIRERTVAAADAIAE